MPSPSPSPARALAGACGSYQENGPGHEFVRLTSVYERDTLTPAVPGTRLDLDPADVAGSRPTYRCLTWYQRGLGITLREGLLGDDRPEPIQARYSE